MSVKDKTASAISASVNAEDRSKGALVLSNANGVLGVYKPGEGYATRLGIMVICMAFVGFACHHWYYNWVFVRDVFDSIFKAISLPGLTRWMSDSGPAKYLSIGGTLVIAVGGFFIAYYFVYCKRSTADFLVKTDTEMSKVSWPAVSPWFKPEAKVWGATYVVLIFTGILALYVFGVDSLLNLISQWSFYPSNS